MKKDTTTTSYQWQPGSTISRVDVRAQKNGQSVAYVYADPASPPEKLKEIRAALRLKGWGTLSDSRDGAFVLRVAGIRDPNELLTTLQGQGFNPNEAKTHTADEATEAGQGIWKSMTSRSLRWSGILATIGNAVSLTEGVLRGIEKNERLVSKGKATERLFNNQTALGATFALADLPLAIVDEHDNSRQLNLLLKKLVKEYEKNGIEIPKQASIYVETSNKGKSGGEHFKDFLHQYANQVKCGFEVVASYFSIKAGMEQGNKGKIAAGAIFGPGFLASLLIPEKKIDGEKYAAAGTLERLWMKVQSNPLSVGGLLGYSNTILTYASAHDERMRFQGKRPPKIDKKSGEIIEPSKYHVIDYGIPTIMIGANGLYAVSKKTVGGNIDSDAMVQDAYRIASQIINKQPPELREKAIETTSRFFGQRMEIKETYQDARTRLVKELGSQRQNPWFEHVSLPPRAPKKSRDAVMQHIAAAPASAPAPQVQASGIEHQSKGIAAANAEQLLATANGR